MSAQYEGSHLEFAATESAALEPTGWERWIAAAEQAIGHDIDGDETEDGYSLDGAYECWRNGWSVAEYAERVRENTRRIDPAAAHFDRVLRDAEFDADGHAVSP